jgi:hypothetical protein
MVAAVTIKRQQSVTTINQAIHTMQIRHYINRRGMLRPLMIVLFIYPLTVWADERRNDCPLAEVIGDEDARIRFGEYQFADGSSDLAISIHNGSGTEIKRVTYDGGATEGCRYTSVVIASGISDAQWGWHLVWTGDTGIFHARMDGEVWVSSPPKRLGAAGASHAELLVNGPELRLRWQERHDGRVEAHEAVSHDEGRSWGPSRRLHSAD